MEMEPKTLQEKCFQSITDFVMCVEIYNSQMANNVETYMLKLPIKLLREWEKTVSDMFQEDFMTYNLKSYCLANIMLHIGCGEKYLLYACKSGKLKMVQHILSTLNDQTMKRHVDVNFQNDKGETPLKLACKRDNLGVVNELLLTLDYKDKDKQVDVNFQGTDGYAPLHDACRRGHLDIVKTLLKTMDNQDEQKQVDINLGVKFTDYDQDFYQREVDNKSRFKTFWFYA